MSCAIERLREVPLLHNGGGQAIQLQDVVFHRSQPLLVDSCQEVTIGGHLQDIVMKRVSGKGPFARYIAEHVDGYQALAIAVSEVQIAVEQALNTSIVKEAVQEFVFTKVCEPAHGAFQVHNDRRHRQELSGFTEITDQAHARLVPRLAHFNGGRGHSCDERIGRNRPRYFAPARARVIEKPQDMSDDDYKKINSLLHDSGAIEVKESSVNYEA